MGTTADEPLLHFAAAGDCEAWLAKHHATSSGALFKIAKKGSDRDSVTYAEALDLALAYGWIDATKRKLDDDFWVQRFTPRGRRSKWSQRNRARALELIAHGAMRPAGLAAVEEAQADDRWDSAYAGQSTAVAPDDLRRALNKHKKAKAFFATLDSHNRYAILYRIQDAKKPETRARRIEKFVAMLNAGEKIYP